MTHVDDLRALLGDVVDTDAAALDAVRSDNSGHSAPESPLAIVHAESVEHVQQTMRFASERGIPVVTRGAGTGLAGGANAGGGELCLSVDRMRRILEVSAADQLAVVEPGIRNAALNDALAEHGMWWAPDPASRAISTVGGNIATNAGGLLCAKYGVTREAVLQLQVVLASGELITVGHRTVKGVTGLDLAALMIGSEGTLGVIVEATLKLRPVVPGGVVTVGAFFADGQTTGERQAAETCAAITANGIRPAIMELVGSTTLRMLSAYTGEPLDQRGSAFVLMQFDDTDAADAAASAVEIARANGADVEVTDDPERSSLLVQVRRQVHFALVSFGTVLVEDVSVPRSRLADMLAFCDATAVRHGVTIATTAHAGDGNLHPTFVFDGDEASDAVWAAADEIFTAAIEMGGTLTGEHGIGVLKRRWLGAELGETQLRLQREIKRVFDPAGILNPGKVF